MTSLDRWLSRLQLSPRAQRVLTEAALDWRCEVATAPTFAVALWRHCRSGLGFLRALSLVALSDLGATVASTWTWRIVVLSVAFLIPSFDDVWHAPGFDTPMHLLVSSTYLLAHWFNWFPWIAFLALVTGPRRAISPVCAVVTGALVAAAGLLYGVPGAFDLVARTAQLPFRDVHIAPPSFLWFGIFLTAGLALLADRVRSNDHRIAETLILAAQLGILALAMQPLSWLSKAVNGRTTVLTLIVAIPFALWFRLVRKQERRQVTS